jgi:hypothetical protein
MVKQKRKIVMLMIGGNEPVEVQSRLAWSGFELARYVSADLEILVPDLQRWRKSIIWSRLRGSTKTEVRVIAYDRNQDLIEKLRSEIQAKEPLILVLDKNHIVEEDEENQRYFRQQILSEITVPILLLTCKQNELKTPFFSIFVPMSCERRTSPALEWAINFANQMHLPVDLLHVTGQVEDQIDDSSVAAKMGHEFCHEYPQLVSDVIAQGSPYTSVAKRVVIRHFMHRIGGALEEIINRGRQQVRPLVVIEWKGTLEGGHAKLLKGILARTDWPVLLTKENNTERCSLKVAGKFQLVRSK